ncbi:MAG TPA: hypothetical protein VED40_10460 [Azospirillaceae bacterium]|nr:hypothetical protein [Azospirillaceae bacterium]
MFRKSIALISAHLAFTAPALAEPCWAIGCVGRVGYVFIPNTQYSGDKDQMAYHGAQETLTHRFSIGNADKTCRFGNRWRVFDQRNLPAVNSEVMLQVDFLRLLEASEVPLAEAELPPPPIHIDPQTGECAERDMDRDGANNMKAGTRLRVLGYTALGADHGLGTLYALVLVLTDGG